MPFLRFHNEFFLIWKLICVTWTHFTVYPLVNGLLSNSPHFIYVCVCILLMCIFGCRFLDRMFFWDVNFDLFFFQQTMDFFTMIFDEATWINVDCLKSWLNPFIVILGIHSFRRLCFILVLKQNLINFVFSSLPFPCQSQFVDWHHS